ncbi:helix-turn-helix domain-containing protein [Streptomyces sp. NPDC048825]|uniref:helix-turn-helix domain-containing protein n=1 Tax=Streptomyces sp. NPDC048825 TaxID=3365592 RepID=UPI00372040CC
MNTHEAGVYDTPDDLLAEFFDDPADREGVKREAERLAAEERGARLVELRERASATREDVARRMGVELARVINLESGAFSPPRVDLSRIDELETSTSDELIPLAQFIFDLAAYIQAIGGDVRLEITQPGGRVWFLPAPTDRTNADLLYTILKQKPESLKVVAEMDGFRTEVA